MSQELATTSTRNISDLRILVQDDRVKEQLAAALPRFYSPDQFAVIVRTAINKNPRLNECTKESFMVALLTAAQMGIAPNGRDGHLIPYGKECQFMPDYKGLVGLVKRNGNVADVYAEPVHENDLFKLTKGLHRDLIHEVDIRQPRGAIVGVYAVISYNNGMSSFEFMSKEEVDAIRKRSRSSGSGPWVTDYSEMAKKTVIRRLLKLADLSPDTAQRLAVADEHEFTPAPAAQIERAQIEQPTRAALPEPAKEPEAKVTKETPRTKLAKVVEQQAQEPEPAKAISIEPDPEPEPQPEATPEPVKERAPEPVKKVAATGDLTPAARLATLIDANGFIEPVVVETFKQFFPRQAASITTVESIPEQVLKAAFLDAESIEELTETLRQNSKI